MSNEIIRYIAEQSGGLLIAVILIMRVEGKLDTLNNEISRLTDTMTRFLLTFSQSEQSQK
ncbi:MAG TPA: YvrJ family protein [Candidatus Limosilactobacillus merdigallinarum]|uniref:YvrJ family protein n=1 Tax=Candidatus Limosilactobacillus merdigallinarum TaxID=2838652 RepID=A0A9D2ALW4_9LACO|nr:YvrJ family protein [Limosilactobacillus pontis]HIX36230.1 YvrJ family protein [Candidatus Limosilactobacillus merdigallinarum]